MFNSSDLDIFMKMKKDEQREVINRLFGYIDQLEVYKTTAQIVFDNLQINISSIEQAKPTITRKYILTGNFE